MPYNSDKVDSAFSGVMCILSWTIEAERLTSYQPFSAITKFTDEIDFYLLITTNYVSVTYIYLILLLIT